MTKKIATHVLKAVELLLGEEIPFMGHLKVTKTGVEVDPGKVFSPPELPGFGVEALTNGGVRIILSSDGLIISEQPMNLSSDLGVSAVSLERQQRGKRARLILEGPEDVVTPQMARAVRSKVTEVESDQRAAKRGHEAKIAAEAKAKIEAEEKAAARRNSSTRTKALDTLSTWAFETQYLERLVGQRTRIVGQHYRDPKANAVLADKRVHNMVLLVPEVDNEVDINAIMVFAWEDEAKKWHHVGYVPASEACLLRSKWSGDYHKVAVARIVGKPKDYDGHRNGNNITLQLTGELRTYPDYVARG